MITQVSRAFEAGGLPPTAEDVADFMWLATWMARAEPAELSPAPARYAPDSHARAIDVERPPPPTVPDEPGDPPPAAPAAPDDWRRRRLELGMALRPLRVRKPSRDRWVMDEEATARRVAEERRWEPVMRAELVRWPDLALVVDGTPSMEVWRHLLAELPPLMERLGGFREVRTWRLAGTAHEGGPGVAPGLLEPAGRWRDAAALADPSGRRLILVVTDGANPEWRGRYPTMVSRWARTNPVGLLSVAPSWQWPAEGLRAQPGHVYASQPLAPNVAWHHRPHRQATGSPTRPLVPVTELFPLPADRFATVLSGGRRWVTTRLAELSAAPAPVARDEDGSPYQAVAAFRSTASTVAFRLLTLLSAVPLTSQVIEYVRQEALPEAEPAHVSEILLSNLVDFAGDRFVFRDPRMRDVLRRRLEPEELAGLRLRAFRRTNTRRELFDHPDGDPRVIEFVQRLAGCSPRALAVTGLVAPRRVAAAGELAVRLPQTRGKTATEPDVVRAADLMDAERGRSAKLLRSAVDRAGRGLLLVDGLGPLTGRGSWAARELAGALVAAMRSGRPGGPVIVLGGTDGEVRAVLDRGNAPADLLLPDHILALPFGPADQAYEICQGLFRGDRVHLPAGLEQPLWEAFRSVHRSTRFTVEDADPASRHMYREVVRRWQDRAERRTALTAADLAAATAEVIKPLITADNGTAATRVTKE